MKRYSFLVQTIDMTKSKVSEVKAKSLASAVKQVRSRFPKDQWVIISYRDLETDKVYRLNEEDMTSEVCS